MADNTEIAGVIIPSPKNRDAPIKPSAIRKIFLSSAMRVVRRFNAAIERRGEIDRYYRELLSNVIGINCISFHPEVTPNFSYFPILISDAYPLTRDQLYAKFQQKKIYPRRYFYPLISQFPMYRGITSAASTNLPVASDVASRVLCLPIYPNLTNEDVRMIAGLIADA